MRNNKPIQLFTYIQSRLRPLANVVERKLGHNLLLVYRLGGQMVASPEQGTYSGIVCSVEEATKGGDLAFLERRLVYCCN